ncbi:MAG: hypothetical protein HYT16_04380 [DPANN group archaeon]|nr:hypothetical protein [DPANN group archaeon]
MKLIITPQVKELGISVCMALVKGANISNRSKPLDKLKKDVADKLQTKSTINNKILNGYKELYSKISAVSYAPPAEHLINLAKKNGQLPNINTIVDCYNLVSAETFLSIGAHDIAHIKGDVIFKITDGSERYTPLGDIIPVKISAGEYACVDGEKILCRMDVKQCNEKKKKKRTTEFIVYVQGNKNTTHDYLHEALEKVCKTIKLFCGGTYDILY